jgi:uncharacterized protein
MRISELYVYPVKGAAGIALDAARLDGFGIEYDRRWMVVDSDGTFLTQRNCAALALLQTTLEPDALVLSSRRAGELRLPLRPESGASCTARVWGDVVSASDAGDEAASFLVRDLERDVRLLFMPDTTLRQADLDYARPGDRVSFADGFPMLLISQAALDALNRRLTEPLSMRRFRPNVVVERTAPHEEDSWRRVRLGSVECDIVKPCARCAVPTIDPATGKAGVEPLRTLADYRRWNGKVWFGQNVIHRARGTLRVGDEVQVIVRGPNRPPLAVAAVGA